MADGVYLLVPDTSRLTDSPLSRRPVASTKLYLCFKVAIVAIVCPGVTDCRVTSAPRVK